MPLIGRIRPAARRGHVLPSMDEQEAELSDTLVTPIPVPINADPIAMAYGFTSEQAQRYSQAMIDYASATGAGGEVMGRIPLVLKAAGKLMDKT
jgi:hypothetical protein